MSDSERYTSKAVLREENLYYDLGYRFTTAEGKKPMKAFNKDYTAVLLIISFLVQTILGISQIFTILSLLILLGVRYMNQEYSKSPIYILLIVSAHVYDYFRQDIRALPGQIIQGRLTLMFWIFEILWVVILSYQFLIIFQPYTPLLAEGQSVKPETIEAKEQYRKMMNRLANTDYAVKPLLKLINIERLQKTLIELIKLIIVIVSASIIFDIVIWRIIGSFAGGDNISEIYVITGMSLILFAFLIGYSHLLLGEEKSEED